MLDLKKEGPTVLDMPPKLQGLLDDMWHRPITDIGAAGPDKIKGGKYLVVPSDNPPKMKFPNLSGVLVPGDFPRDFEYFRLLADFINYETVSREDFAMRGMLAGLGIVKGGKNSTGGAVNFGQRSTPWHFLQWHQI